MKRPWLRSCALLGGRDGSTVAAIGAAWRTNCGISASDDGAAVHAGLRHLWDAAR